jgi:hypothetical protein
MDEDTIGGFIVRPLLKRRSTFLYLSLELMPKESRR